MGIYIGCDVGTVSVKAAVIWQKEKNQNSYQTNGTLKRIACESRFLEKFNVAITPYRRIQGNPMDAAIALLQEIISSVPGEHVMGLCLTGSGGELVADFLQANVENEFKAVAHGVASLYPDVKYIFEMGGENSKFLRINVDSETHSIGIEDYDTNGDCAAGTGSFMDQQASRLKYDIEDVGDIVLSCNKSAKIAGRCSVFAKSDMIHAQQKGATPPEVLRGLCEAVARNFKGNIAKGREPAGRTAFVGGVAKNKGVKRALENVFGFSNGNLFVPDEPAFCSAVGAALIELARAGGSREFMRKLNGMGKSESAFPAWQPLTLKNVRLLRDEAEPYCFPSGDLPIDAYLGIDIGSVSTNLVVIDNEAKVVHEIYLRTEARPVEVVGRGLKEIEEKLGGRIRVKGVGTTGSGRELIGELVGADTVNDEITAHKTGAFQIAEKYLGSTVDTIFEIGGQDSKFISLQGGVVVDFAMNEACAAGTGSFLEEQAEKLNVNIKEEFSKSAFEAEKPVRLGERCTVYMEQDVTSYQQKGANKSDLIAGLSYSVVQNYLNRVVRGRRIGEIIFFQGGTAYNDSVAAAFSQVLGKQIIVPPHNGVVGAYGVAILAREKVLALDNETMFRGYDIEKVDYKMREFTCKACSNFCDIQEFNVEGKKTFWGDKCSEKYRKEARTAKKPVIPDLLKLREEALMRDYYRAFVEGDYGKELRREATELKSMHQRGKEKISVGLPRAMYFYDRFPFWNTYFTSLGFEVLLSDPTTKQIAHIGVEEAVAEPCYPIQIAHGHANSLFKSKASHYFLPNVINAESNETRAESYMCPWGQTLPFVISSNPMSDGVRERIISPTLHFRQGEKFVERELWNVINELLKKITLRHTALRRLHKLAVHLAYRAQGIFHKVLLQAGSEAMDKLKSTGEIGIVIVGRPYNIYDRGINMNIPSKLRSYYGVNVIPLDFLYLDDVGISDINPNMFWSYGRKILQAARLTGQDSNLHVIYITNFKCGPDSYIKQFTEIAAVKPFLTLQFDGHGNDAGMMTRCEAYLDSKGVIRWWQRSHSKEGLSTYQGCPTEEPEPSQLLFAQ